MVVQRNTFMVKQGKLMEAMDLVKQAFEVAPSPGNYRLYTDFVGKANMMAWEVEFEDLAAFQEGYERCLPTKAWPRLGPR